VGGYHVPFHSAPSPERLLARRHAALALAVQKTPGTLAAPARCWVRGDGPVGLPDRRGILHLAGRKVHLAVGGAPAHRALLYSRQRTWSIGSTRWAITAWPVHGPPHEGGGWRAKANHYVTGSRRRAATSISASSPREGMRLYGRAGRQSAPTRPISITADLGKEPGSSRRRRGEHQEHPSTGFIASKGIAAPCGGALRAGVGAGTTKPREPRSRSRREQRADGGVVHRLSCQTNRLDRGSRCSTARATRRISAG